MDNYTGPDPGYKPMQGVDYGNGGIVQPAIGSTRVVFFSKAKLMPAKSKEQGHDVWENIDYVSVQQVTEKYPIVLEAHAGHRQRWPSEYEAFLKGREMIPEGTPMNILIPGNEAMVNELRGMAIFTIEQMAEVPDSVIHRIPFGTDMKNRARKYLEAMNGAQGFNKVQAELDRAKEDAAETARELAELKVQMAAMQSAAPQPAALDPNVMAMLTALTARTVSDAPKPKRGRPPKKTEISEEAE